MVSSTIRRVPPVALREQRVLVLAEDGREVGEHLVELVARTGATGASTSWARLSFEAATNCIARVICLMLRTDAMRRRISRWLGTCG